MRVVLVRHAESAPGEPDEERTLTEQGRSDAAALARRLHEDGVRLDAVLTSPLARARETGAALAAAAGVEAVADERLAPGATPQAVLAAATGRGETVAIVGHQPDCGLVVAELTGNDPPPFPPAGWALVELPG